jgi:hypothetical protein
MRRLSPRGGVWVIGLLALLTFLRVARMMAGPRVHAAQTPEPTPGLTATAEPPVPFGRVIYRAAKAASFESLGVTVIACRHFDPGPRQFTVDFFAPDGKKVGMFGPYIAGDVPPGKKVVFVTDATYFRKRDVFDVRLGHLTGGPARVISDAKIVRCMGKIRFDAGVHIPSRWDTIGFYRAGVGATPAPVGW